jgi:hypothetical protein
MGAYIGSALAKLGNSYLDERENQADRKRREMLDAESAQDRQAAIQDRRTTLQRLQEQMDFQQSEATRKTQLAEQERESLRRALLSKGLPAEQVEGMLGDPVASRSYLTQPKPTKNRASSTFTVDGKTPQMGSFDAEEGAYYDGRGNRVENAQPWQKPMSDYERQSLDIRRQAASRVGGARAGKALPSSIVEKLGAYDALDQMGEEVTAALKNAIAQKQDITGRVAGVVKTPTWWKNSAPTSIGGKPAIDDGAGGDTGVDVRSMMGNLYATLAKERGGTALSANEIRLLESYLPNENEDESRAFLKATRFVKELRRLKAAKLAAFQKYGYSVDDGQPVGDALADLWEK